MEAAGSQPRAAKLADLSVRQIAAYLAGTSAPPFFPLARLAIGTGHDLHWLMTGQGSPTRDRIAQAQADAAELTVTIDHAWKNTRQQYELGQALSAELKPLYADAGMPMTEDEEDELVGEGIDSVVELGQLAQWKQFVRPIADAHRAAVRHITKKMKAR